MIKIDSNRLRSETKPNITSAISNLNQASSLLKEIKIPDNFCYLSDLKVIPSQIDQIVTDVKGINTYIDQKTAEFDAVRNARVPIGIGVRANVLNYEYNLTTAKKTGASATNLFISFVKGIADFGESLIDTAAVVTSIPLTVLTAGQDIAQNLKSGKGLWDIDFKNTKNLWSGTMSMVAEDTVGNAFSKFYEKTKVGNWLDTNEYTPFKSGRGVAKVAEGIGQIAGVVALTVFTCGAGTGAVGTATAAKAAATKATVSSAIAGARGFGEGAEYLWGKQRDSSWAGLQRIHKRGEISNETIELYKNIRNMSEKKIYKLYRSGKATKEEYNAMLQINRMPEDWITTKNATSGLLYGAATGGWEALQYYAGNKLNNFSIKGASALANAATRVGIDTGFNAADTPFRAGVESILTRKNFKKLFDEQGGVNAVLVSAGVGALGSTIGEISQYLAQQKVKHDGTWIYSVDDIDKINENDLNAKEKLHLAKRKQIEYLKSKGLDDFISDAPDPTKYAIICDSDEEFEKNWVKTMSKGSKDIDLNDLERHAKYVLGYYDPKKEKVVLRPNSTVDTIIHELNHRSGNCKMKFSELSQVMSYSQSKKLIDLYEEDESVFAAMINNYQTQADEAFTESISLRADGQSGYGNSEYGRNVKHLNRLIELVNYFGEKDLDLKTYFGKDKTLFAREVNTLSGNPDFYYKLIHYMYENSIDKKSGEKLLTELIDGFEKSIDVWDLF